MNPESDSSSDHPPTTGRLWWTAALMVGAIATFFVVREHWQHMAGAWAYLLLLACPILHLFHGHGSSHANHSPKDSQRK